MEVKCFSPGNQGTVPNAPFLTTALRGLAARRLAELFARECNAEKSARYAALAKAIGGRAEAMFATECGLLKAFTGRSSQPDVWGSAFAVYHGLVPQACCKRIAEALADELRRGQIAWQGQICHVPLEHAARPDSLGECTPMQKNEYQNGAYW